MTLLCVCVCIDNPSTANLERIFRISESRKSWKSNGSPIFARTQSLTLQKKRKKEKRERERERERERDFQHFHRKFKFPLKVPHTY